MPARRGDEITDDILEGRHSVVIQQAGNRLAVGQAIMEWVLGLNEDGAMVDPSAGRDP
jgi:ornithine carbamoyltransferase